MTARNGMKLVHPGDVSHDEFIAPGLSANALSKALGKLVTTIMNGQLSVGADIAPWLARYFGTTPQLRMNSRRTWTYCQTEIVAGHEITKCMMSRQLAIIGEVADASS